MPYHIRTMTTQKSSVLFFSLFAVLLLSSCSRKPEEQERKAGEQPSPSARPSFAAPSNTVVRALSASSFGQAATEKPQRSKSASKDLQTVIDSANPSKEQRLAALSKLGRDLGDNDAQTLMDFLGIYNDADVLPPEKLNVVKNDITNLLRGQKRFPESLPWRLMAMWRDKNHDDVWRDYCIQHAGASLGRTREAAAEAEAGRFFYEVAAAPDAPGSGTALIALRNLVNAGKADKVKVAEIAIITARSEEAPQGVRVTALQIASELDHEETAPTARSLVNDRTKTMHLRVSAIAALGRSGDESDLPVLEKLAASSDYRLRLAAVAAVKKLKEKSH